MAGVMNLVRISVSVSAFLFIVGAAICVARRRVAQRSFYGNFTHGFQRWICGLGRKQKSPPGWGGRGSSRSHAAGGKDGQRRDRRCYGRRGQKMTLILVAVMRPDLVSVITSKRRVVRRNPEPS